MGTTGKKSRTAEFVRTKAAGIYVRHMNDCRAAFGEGRCGCEPFLGEGARTAAHVEQPRRCVEIDGVSERACGDARLEEPDH